MARVRTNESEPTANSHGDGSHSYDQHSGEYSGSASGSSYSTGQERQRSTRKLHQTRLLDQKYVRAKSENVPQTCIACSLCIVAW